MDKHLRAHPDTVISGDADAPPSVHRLLRHPHAGGHPVTVAAWGGCGQQRPLPERGPQGRVCSSCACEGRMRLCYRCGPERVVAAALAQGPL